MRLASTLCGVVLSLGLAAQKPLEKHTIPIKPVTEDYIDFSDWRTTDSTVYARLSEMHTYGLPRAGRFVDEVVNAIFYLDRVLVPDWSAIPPGDTAAGSFVGALQFSGDSTIHLPNRFSDDAAYFYFLNGSDGLASSDTADIRTLVEYHLSLRERGEWSGLSPRDTALRFTITGFSDKSPYGGLDELASEQKNYALSADRALAIGGVIKSFYPEAIVEIRALGNAEQLDDGINELSYAFNRAVHVVPGMTAIECGLEKTKADFTISDASRSMMDENGAQYTPLEIVKLYPYENGNVFLFSDRGIVWRGDGYVYNHPNPDDSPTLLISYAPSWIALTPLDQVMLYLALVADEGTSFRFITDGKNSSGGQRNNYARGNVQHEHVISVAQQRNIMFSFIGMGPYTPHFDKLQRIASETGGQTYFPCDPKN